MPRELERNEIENVTGQMLADLAGGWSAPGLGEYGILEVEAGVSPDRFAQFGRAEEASMVAVDGGSAVLLDAGSFIVAGVRVGSVAYSGKEPVKGRAPESHLLYLAAHDIGKAYSIFFRKAVGEEPPDQPRGLEEALGRIRTLLEWKHLEQRVSEATVPGTVIALDGALWAGIKGMGPMLDRIVRSAAAKGILLCGISKKSMLTHLSKPLIPTIQLAGAELLRDSTWHYPVMESSMGEKLYGDIHVARLHPASRYVFRVDIALPAGIRAAEAFGKLAHYSNDPTYTGYPYPLARVHNDVAFSRFEVEDIRRMLRAEALKRGMGQGEWQMTFQDFHDVLDGNR